MNLAHCIDGHPDGAAALLVASGTVTYGELRERAGHWRAWLAQCGAAVDDPVALVVSSAEQFVAAYLGVLGFGAVAVPLNPLSPAPERAAQCTAAAVRLTIDDDTLLPSSADSDTAIRERSDDELAALMFTSGTAGAPLPAMLTHGNLRANLEQLQSTPGCGLRPSDVVYCALPLFHIFGLNAVAGFALHAGAGLILDDHFDAHRSLELIARHRATVVPGAPPMWHAWSVLPGAPTNAFSGVRMAVSGAAKLPEDVARSIESRFGLRVDEGYGLTEASPIVTAATGRSAKVGSIGVPLHGVEVRLVDASGGDALVGDDGEIWVRGPNVFKGYLNDPAATGRVLTGDGWLHTGDIAVIDDDGDLFIVDRAKDLIIVSGFNVYPAEVEEVLATHPAVVDVGVIGVPDDHTGETVKAFVVLRPGSSTTVDELSAHVCEHLARYKCPSSIELVGSLPRAITGKLLRRRLNR